MEDRITHTWRKATYSGNGGGDCVEVGERAGTVLVRDSKRRDIAELRFRPATWRRFIASVKR
jgi:hypothetical protein